MKIESYKGTPRPFADYTHAGVMYRIGIYNQDLNKTPITEGEVWSLTPVHMLHTNNVIFCRRGERLKTIEKSAEAIAPEQLLEDISPPPEAPAEPEVEHPLWIEIKKYAGDGAWVEAKKEGAGRDDRGWEKKAPIQKLRVDRGWLKFEIVEPPKKQHGKPVITEVEAPLVDLHGKTVRDSRWVGEASPYRFIFFFPA